MARGLSRGCLCGRCALSVGACQGATAGFQFQGFEKFSFLKNRILKNRFLGRVRDLCLLHLHLLSAIFFFQHTCLQYGTIRLQTQEIGFPLTPYSFKFEEGVGASQRLPLRSIRCLKPPLGERRG